MPVKQVRTAVEVVNITPKMASRWLDANHGNRNIRPRLVTAYARDMSAGRWQFTGEAIRFSRSDRLIDGQHRLHAVVQSGVTVQMVVVRDLEDEAQSVIDSGSSRTASDALRMRGEPNSVALAAGARIAMQFQDGRLEQGSGYKYTHSEIGEWLNRNPEMRAAVEFSTAISRMIDMPPSVVTLCIWRLNWIDADDCAAFFHQLAYKTRLEPGSAILALVHRQGEVARSGRAISRSAHVSLVFRTWNYWRAGKTINTLHVMRGGEEIEIPQPR